VVIHKKGDQGTLDRNTRGIPGRDTTGVLQTRDVPFEVFPSSFGPVKSHLEISTRFGVQRDRVFVC